MPDVLLSALVQAPFVLVMAYLVNQFLTHLDARDEEWRTFMNEADGRLAERLSSLTESVEKLAEKVVAHDVALREVLRRREKEAASAQPCQR